MRIKSIPVIALLISCLLLCPKTLAFQPSGFKATSSRGAKPLQRLPTRSDKSNNEIQSPKGTTTTFQMGFLNKAQRFSPAKAIQPWMWINAIVLGWSVLLLIELLVTQAPGDRLEGTQAYLVYNFGSTIIWVAESSLNGVDFACENKESRAPIAGESWFERNSSWLFLVLELGLAIYFLYDSIDLLQKWKIPDADIGADFLDTSINTGAYLYQILKVSSLEEPFLSSSSGSNGYIEVRDSRNATPDV